MMSWTRRLFPLVCSVWLAPSAFGAACCGGGLAAPALILGDDNAQLTASYAYSQVGADVGTDALWRKREARELSETVKLEGAHIFADQWQAGFSVPILRRSLGSRSATGLGDLSANLGYEYLPDWDYNPWRPRALGYLQLTAPTGKSANEADATSQLDSRGRGFWAVGLGTVLTKAWGRWDLFGNFDVHRSFPRRFDNSLRLVPGFGGNLGFGGGVNFAALRFGAGLNWSYEDAVRSNLAPGAPQRFATASLSAAYLLPREISGTLTYLDQTLFGHPLNTSLGRGVAFFLQKRWLR